ncbi:Cys/Met metabolism PLP-dependent enzyme domain protein, partial [Bordetella bronchiseptica E012]
DTSVVYCESPGSLTMEMQDFARIAAAAHAVGAKVVADNTWATPVFLQPFEHGIDVSIHAATKYRWASWHSARPARRCVWPYQAMAPPSTASTPAPTRYGAAAFSSVFTFAIPAAAENAARP